ncbi:MAG: signal recognition particle-docking protein FtsY [archaeon]
MFENLKKKLKGFLSKASAEVEVEVKEPVDEVVEEVPKAPKAKSQPPIAKKKETKSKKEKKKAAAVEDEILKEVEAELEPGQVEPELELVVEEPKPEVKVELEPEPEKPEELEPVAEPESESESKPEPEIEDEPEPEVEEESEEEPEPEPIVEEEPTPEPEIEPEVKEETKIEASPGANASALPPRAGGEPKKKGFFGRFRKPKEPDKEPEKPKKRFLSITRKKISEKNLDKILWELELLLLENDIAKEVTEAITAETKARLMEEETSSKSPEQMIESAIKDSLQKILTKEQPDIIKLIKAKKDKPYVIVFFGFNGTGKTMTIGKFAKMLQDAGLSVVMAAGDTFRAAAIEQLDVHAKNLNVPIIKQVRGSDSAAVIYDAIAHAKARKIDVVLADTAGRSGTNINLMDELKKVVRVNKPDLKIFVGDALTGNDAADQAKAFHEAVGIDGSVLTKVDCDPKGGSCISVSYVTDAPILYFGTGQGYADMKSFDAEWFLSKVF